MFTSDPSFFRKSSLICSLITSTSVSDELLALFLNHFFRKYTAQSRAKLSWTQRQRIICNRLWKQPADWQVLCLRDWNSFSCFVIFFIKSFAPNAQCWCKSQKAGWASRFKNVHWSNFAKPRRGRPRSVKLFEPRAAKGPKSWRGRPWSGKLFGLAVCQEPRSGLNVPSRLLIHPIIPNAFRLKWSFS